MNKVKTIKNKPITRLKKEIFTPYFMDASISERLTLKSMLEDFTDNLNIEYYTGEDSIESFSCEKLEFQYCCGLNEIGDFSVDKTFPIDILSNILDGMIEYGSNSTIIATTNGKNESIVMEKAFIKCKNWQLVKTFKNPRSGNTLKVWMSNN